MIEFLFLLHLVSALPIVLNPPFQFFEEILKIPTGLTKYFLRNIKLILLLGFGYRRVLLRTGIMSCLLLIALSIPNFGAILNLIGATTITLLNFVFPPIFYLILHKKYQVLKNIGKQRDTESTKSEDFAVKEIE